VPDEGEARAAATVAHTVEVTTHSTSATVAAFHPTPTLIPAAARKTSTHPQNPDHDDHKTPASPPRPHKTPGKACTVLRGHSVPVRALCGCGGPQCHTPSPKTSELRGG